VPPCPPTKGGSKAEERGVESKLGEGWIGSDSW
jgi:hypothetical protein